MAKKTASKPAVTSTVTCPAPVVYRSHCSKCGRRRDLTDAEVLQARGFGGLLSRCCHAPTTVHRAE